MIYYPDLKVIHNEKHLWLESGILSSNDLTFKDAIKKISKYAKDRVKQIEFEKELIGEKLTAEEQSEEYKNTFGWMGEVLVEFYLKFFYRGPIKGFNFVGDTSDDKFRRGIDLETVHHNGKVGCVQVKMRARSDSEFKEEDLFTFLDEINKTGIYDGTSASARYSLLFIPTNFSNSGLHHSFPKPLQFTVVTGSDMMKEILQLPSPDKPARQIFFENFAAALKMMYKS